MQIILKKDMKSLGKTGDIVSVTKGYARNFLIPQGIAVEATKSNLKLLDWENKQVNVRRNKELREAKEIAQSVKKLSLTIRCEVGENEKLYGSVTTNDILEALANEGIVLEKKQIVLEEPIKTLGIYTVPLKLDPEVEANVKIWVVKK